MLYRDTCKMFPSPTHADISLGSGDSSPSQQGPVPSRAGCVRADRLPATQCQPLAALISRCQAFRTTSARQAQGHPSQSKLGGR